MATLDELLNSSLSNEMMTPQSKQAAIDRIVANAMPENLRKYGTTAQQQNEAAFGKGMGLSTWNAYQQALNSLAQTEGAGQIENAAQHEIQAAQNAAVGNAASYATAEKNRAASVANAQMANQTVRRGQNIARDAQTRNLIYGGLGGLATGASGIGARMFGPELKEGLKGAYAKLFGPGTPGQPGQPATEQAPTVGPSDVGQAGDMGAANAAPGYAPPDLSNLGFSGPTTSFDASAYSPTPTFTDPQNWDFSQADLANLFNSANAGWGQEF